MFILSLLVSGFRLAGLIRSPVNGGTRSRDDLVVNLQAVRLDQNHIRRHNVINLNFDQLSRHDVLEADLVPGRPVPTDGDLPWLV